MVLPTRWHQPQSKDRFPRDPHGEASHFRCYPIVQKFSLLEEAPKLAPPMNAKSKKTLVHYQGHARTQRDHRNSRWLFRDDAAEAEVPSLPSDGATVQLWHNNTTLVPDDMREWPGIHSWTTFPR
eukprot:1489907-Amphidinium_carterae.1